MDWAGRQPPQAAGIWRALVDIWQFSAVVLAGGNEEQAATSLLLGPVQRLGAAAL